MKILIDTQIILWILTDGKKLKQNEIDIINSPDNEIICSSISIFEISLKYSIGKLELKNFTPEMIPELLQNNGYRIKNVGFEVFSSFYNLPNDIHKDPFDRILIWESIKNDFTIMTRDTKILEYKKHGLKTVLK
ncbi:MAG: type II toxin-antitoxin system VapC family toxin [Spirochaetales bacterium]|nr:type II toxin-antitoxin system VapC family toxin [Spirochaetales bacterium]